MQLTYTTPVDFSAFDLVVVQESFGSGDAILKPAGSLGIEDCSLNQ
jgi:hypothetical protein